MAIVPRADVVIVGAGLAGLSAAIALAETGMKVQVLAKGHTATHWASGGMDIGATPGSETSRAGVERLASFDGHPYVLLGGFVERALAWLQATLEAEGLSYVGDLDSVLRPVPTALGGTRPAAILPAGQAPAARRWSADEQLVVCGIARFKDFWASAIAASLRRAQVWGVGEPPRVVDAVTVELPGLVGRHNLNALDIARRFDDASWRDAAIDAIARAVDRARSTGGGRVALPAVLGLEDHPAVMDALGRRLPLEPFEVPLVPPSVPGVRLYGALRAALRRRGGRILVGEPVLRVDVEGRRVTRVAAAAAVRENVYRTEALVLATGGIAGGGIVARPDGRLEEPVLGLPVEAPEADHWLATDPFDPAGHPLEAAGIRVDSELRPVGRVGETPLLENARIVGSLLAGQRYLRERCGDGVAIASGWRAAVTLAGTSRAVPDQVGSVAV
jgi:glycerol-3-phosphate dehydrogenase subunit B